MSVMNTYSGRKFDPMKIASEDVYLEDIAHALSLVCRGGGQIRWFYSVGQHSINCAHEALAVDGLTEWLLPVFCTMQVNVTFPMSSARLKSICRTTWKSNL